MKKIRVCHIGTGVENPGGMTTVIQDLLANQKLTEFEQIHIVSVAPEHKLKVFLLAILKFIEEHRKEAIDIAHLHMSEYGSCYRKIVFILLCRMLKIKTIVHSHGSEFENFLKKSKGSFIFKKIVKLADKVLVLTPGWMKIWETLIPSDKIEILPNAVSLPEINRKKYYKNNQLNLLFLGYIGHRKGTYDLIRAVKELVNDELQVSLKIGGNGEVEKAKKMVDELDLSRNIDILGWVDSDLKDRLLREADILVLPSYFESFGIVLLEAMSYKLPVICGDGGFSKEIISDGLNGYVVKSGDVQDIKEKISLFFDRHIAEVLGNNARETVEKFYTFETIGSQLRKIYLRMVE